MQFAYTIGQVMRRVIYRLNVFIIIAKQYRAAFHKNQIQKPVNLSFI
jgi:hypothetical protein